MRRHEIELWAAPILHRLEMPCRSPPLSRPAAWRVSEFRTLRNRSSRSRVRRRGAKVSLRLGVLANGLWERTSGEAGQPLSGYRRRTPARTVLHEPVALHAQTMLATFATPIPTVVVCRATSSASSPRTSHAASSPTGSVASDARRAATTSSSHLL